MFIFLPCPVAGVLAALASARGPLTSAITARFSDGYINPAEMFPTENNTSPSEAFRDCSRPAHAVVFQYIREPRALF